MTAPATPDPAPWLHENGTRYDHCHHAPPGALFWIPRPEYTTEKETPDA